MVKLYFFIVIVLSLYIFIHSRLFRNVSKRWEGRGFPLVKNKLTMFDVRRLLIKGEKDLAVRVYSEIFKTNTADAVKAVEDIERSIQPKDFEI